MFQTTNQITLTSPNLSSSGYPQRPRYPGPGRPEAQHRAARRGGGQQLARGVQTHGPDLAILPGSGNRGESNGDL